MKIRYRRKIIKDIKKYQKKLDKTPDGDPNVGHIATIMIGLYGELEEWKRNRSSNRN